MDKDKKHLDFKEIGHRIRLEREMLNLSRERLAEIIELSPFYIGQIERGERKMSLDTLVKFSNTFNVSVDYLLFASNLHNEDLELKNFYTVLEAAHNDYNSEFNEDLKELLIILSRLNHKEIVLIKEIIILLFPYIKQ
ncbi:MAG: helix-turn-helix transcriptional regulator [Tissierellia bacterium]|nr:helix-turn-helix transcriptional regulator [Tissierellia bacterium]